MSKLPYSKVDDPSLQESPIEMYQQMPKPTDSQVNQLMQQFKEAGQPVTMVAQQPMMNQPMTPIYGQAPLGPRSQRMRCTHCQASIMTRVSYDTGSKTHLIAFLLCIFHCCLGCCFIPYYVDSMRNANHYCPQCNTFMGTHKP